jgi:hypothetical protein
MDRNMDLITPVQHASTYQALVDDVLDHKANRVEFNVKQDGNATSAQTRGGRAPPVVRKKLDIDPDMDPFYSRHKFNPFPEAIESNGAELQEVSAREQQIRSKTGGGVGIIWRWRGFVRVGYCSGIIASIIGQKKEIGSSHVNPPSSDE